MATAKNSPGLVPAYSRSSAVDRRPGSRRSARYSTSTHVLPLSVVGQQRGAIDNAVVHVDLVGELVKHDVPTEPRVRRLASSGAPRHHQRSVIVVRLAVDCLGRTLERAAHRTGRVALGHRPIAHDDRPDAVVPRLVEAEDRQHGMGGDDRPDLVGQLETTGGFPPAIAEQPVRQLTEAVAFVRRQESPGNGPSVENLAPPVGQSGSTATQRHSVDSIVGRRDDRRLRAIEVR